MSGDEEEEEVVLIISRIIKTSTTTNTTSLERQTQGYIKSLLVPYSIRMPSLAPSNQVKQSSKTVEAEGIHEFLHYDIHKHTQWQVETMKGEHLSKRGRNPESHSKRQPARNVLLEPDGIRYDPENGELTKSQIKPYAACLGEHAMPSVADIVTTLVTTVFSSL
ncbi:hypothetical protein EVAR_33267_1 [Eumeta japonica]|uniref:Uncharacterized protein n=1 Tax=Eumeta variegata TaxID=151549 RepID=A0A4C1X2Y3_EUMVA|nr:hypothetical protein EVAR_33267_1 [Eumeta japonica]